MGQVVKLVDSVHSSMEEAAERFANAETTIGGMSRDAKDFELSSIICAVPIGCGMVGSVVVMLWDRRTIDQR